MPSPEYVTFLSGALGNAARVSREGALAFVCCDWRHATEVVEAGKRVFGELINWVVWVKTNAGQGSFYRSQHEFVPVFRVGSGPHLNNIELGRHGRNRSNVWKYAGVNTFRTGRMDELRSHPTAKPVAMVADAIRDCTRLGDVVLDTFCGSGSTIMAAERVGRRGYGMEIDPLYVDVTIRRWQAFTKEDAIQAESGQTFDELAADREAKDEGSTRPGAPSRRDSETDSTESNLPTRTSEVARGGAR